ncbi:hypothetical protein GCM10023187_14930 [Nibrella viscosa]|uniref:histidine kinase n=1 Tax=Nibrella viscosa TaxID=1084524 RepID=A0ABP8K699_9BACT
MTEKEIADQELEQIFFLFMDAFFHRIDHSMEKLEAMCDELITGVGTGKDENIINRDQYLQIHKRDFEQTPEGADYRVHSLQCRRMGIVGLIAAEIAILVPIADQVIELFTRLTLIVEQKKAQWQAVHMHVSFPSSDQAEGESWPLDAMRARQRALEQQVTERTAQLKERTLKLEEALYQLKATQQQLIQKEKLASLGELTAGIAHEIQNPLNFVNNLTEVSQELVGELREEKRKEERDEDLEEELLTDLEESLQKVSHHGKRADSIVKGMLQHSRAGSGEKQPTDLNALADEYLRLAYHGLRAKDQDFTADLRLQLDPNLQLVNIAPQEIGRVLLNLYNNAFYAVQEKHKQQTDYQPQIEVATHTRNGKVALRVKDNGTGIPAEILNKIYQPFFTTKPTGQGTGLGLSLSYDIVTKGHGGEMQVHTTEGEGTEFIVELPA